jgi:methyl-accepting chemotaxis protein
MKIPYTIIKRQEYQQLILDKKELEKNIADATGFIKAIELGELDTNLFLESHNNSSLSGALLSMRNQMKIIEEKERERNWSTEGLAKFVEILRSNNDNIEILYNNIMPIREDYL